MMTEPEQTPPAAPRISDHPQRYKLINELHARPFPALTAPQKVSFFAIKQPQAAAERPKEADDAHIVALCRRYGVPEPPPGANHHYVDCGRFHLKWERHTEFVSYTIFANAGDEEPFAKPAAYLLPPEWLDNAPGALLVAVHIRLETAGVYPDEAGLPDTLKPYFVRESVAGSRCSESKARVWGDFRIHEDGFGRFIIAAGQSASRRQLGRIVQRVLEIQTYAILALLALPIARETNGRLSRVDRELGEIITQIGANPDVAAERGLLAQLTALSADIETLSARAAFRLSAAEAYAALVTDRIETLREQRMEGLQTVEEFMQRRFDPAMRTCDSAARTIETLAQRCARAANLLRTRVNVAVEEQNRSLLHSMDRRAGLQLRLQETVEGLSVVAISYYAVSLLGYITKPLSKMAGLSADWLKALLVLPVLMLVWLFIRRLKTRLEKD